ncbi:hypothetical protein GUJ93_ZPchr0013g37503 [Zizania palustris]|uniref:Uncharacterized protein n=1 Tax=Zizania palustris TaxID=103762 RepID=A0A8J5WWE7_ZIZPA|nr:hypothetical protein GUJ93_ZPchr0013g37503 [Zizania palustris]
MWLFCLAWQLRTLPRHPKQAANPQPPSAPFPIRFFHRTPIPSWRSSPPPPPWHPPEPSTPVASTNSPSDASQAPPGRTPAPTSSPPPFLSSPAAAAASLCHRGAAFRNPHREGKVHQQILPECTSLLYAIRIQKMDQPPNGFAARGLFFSTLMGKMVLPLLSSCLAEGFPALRLPVHFLMLHLRSHY